MKMTLREYIQNPMGIANAVISNREMYRKFYNEKFEEQFSEYKVFNYFPEGTFDSLLYYPTLDNAINDIVENEETSKPVRELK